MDPDSLIYRYEHHHFRGYLFQTTRRGLRHVKYFSDQPGGWRASRARARAYRDWLLPRLPPPARVQYRNSANTTGTIGVALSKDRTRSGSVSWRYAAYWPVKGGRPRKASFSVAKYGRREARRLAIEARQRGLAGFIESVSFRDYQKRSMPKRPKR